jgi:hypothetical protein
MPGRQALLDYLCVAPAHDQRCYGHIWACSAALASAVVTLAASVLQHEPAAT